MQNEIEQMAKDLENHTCMSEFQAEIASKMLYIKGYRKTADLAEEIFAEMREEIVRYLMLKEENGECNEEYWKGKLSAFKQIQGFIDTELKKKYTEGK